MAAMAAVFTFSFQSCSQDDEVSEVKAKKQNAIGYNVLANSDVSTRGYAINSSNVGTELPNFQTWAYDDNTDVIYVGTSATAGITVTNTGSAWDYSPTQFWPVNPLNFVAIAPAAPNGVTGNSTTSASNVVTLTTNVTLPTDVEDQDDIMYAEGDDMEYSDDSGNVPFTFKHALSQIVFRGKFDGEHAISKVTVAEIALGGINKTGTLVFDSEGYFYGSTSSSEVKQPASYSEQAVFSLDASDLEASVWNENAVLTPAVLYEAGDPEVDGEPGSPVVGDVKTPAVLQGTTPFDLTVSNNASKKNAWMLLPQTVQAWDGSSVDGNGVPVGKGAYIKLRVKLEKYNSATDSYVTIKSEADAIYLPLSVNWDRSTRYIYTIIFNGANALEPITFSVAAEDWTDAASQPADVEY